MSWKLLLSVLTLFDSVVTNYGFDLDVVNDWDGQSNAVLRLEHILYNVPHWNFSGNSFKIDFFLFFIIKDFFLLLIQRCILIRKFVKKTVKNWIKIHVFFVHDVLPVIFCQIVLKKNYLLNFSLSLSFIIFWFTRISFWYNVESNKKLWEVTKK